MPARHPLPVFLVVFLLWAAASAPLTAQPADTVEAAVAPAPKGFAGIDLGMDLEEVKQALIRDPQFTFRGDPDVSLLSLPNEALIETEGFSFIDRAYFQFYEGRLYTIILSLNPERVDHFSMYTRLVERYGQPTSLDPTESVWEFEGLRLSLERPLSVKYVDTLAFAEILRQNAQTESLNALTRERFLDQF
jgi:hypothetical protein